MRYAIISDIHANSSALKHTLEDASANGVQRIVCLGDAVGYGPMPSDAIAMLRATRAIMIAGNHDDAVANRISPADFNDLAADAVHRHRAALSNDDLGWLGRLDYVCKLEGAIAAHGDFTNPPAFNYIDDEDSAKANFQHTDAALMFVGHTHIPEIFITGASGKVYRMPAQDFSLEDDKRYIVNPGSVGYPRENNGKCFSSYVIYDSTERTIRFRFIPFSVASVMQRGFARSSPWRTLAFSAITCLAVALVLVFSHSSSGEKPSVDQTTVSPSSSAPSAAPFERKSLTIPFAHQYVKANLKLKSSSAPVLMKLEFRNSNGESLSPISVVVKGRNSRNFKIPSGTVSAEFSLYRCTPNEKPAIESFLPASSPDSGRKPKPKTASLPAVNPQ